MNFAFSFWARGLVFLAGLGFCAALAGAQPESTVKMAGLLKELSRKADPEVYEFLSDRRVTVLEERLERTPDLRARLPLHEAHFLSLLNSGRSEAALEACRRYRDLVQSQFPPPQQWRRHLYRGGRPGGLELSRVHQRSGERRLQ